MKSVIAKSFLVPLVSLGFATAAAVINETTATGPTDKVLLVPNTAYTTSGRILAYSPTCAGNPASKA